MQNSLPENVDFACIEAIDREFEPSIQHYSSLWGTTLDASSTNTKGANSALPYDDNTAMIPQRLKYSELPLRYPSAPSDAIGMGIADMDVQPPSSVTQALSSFMAQHYGYQSLDIGASVSQWFARQNVAIPPDAVVSVASVISAIDIALSVYCQQGDHVMIMTPTYGPLRERVISHGLHVVDIALQPLEPGKENLVEIDLDGLDPSCSAFVLCHPNNPTGTVLPLHTQAAIARFCVKHDILLLVDEVHSEFGFLGAKPPAAISPFAYGVSGIQDHIIRINGASKAFNLSALPGASYVIIENALRRQWFENEVNNRHLAATPLAKLALITVYAHGEPWLNEVRQALHVNRLYAQALLSVLCPEVPFTLGQAGYFLWLNLTQHCSPDSFEYACKRGVIGVAGAQFNAPEHLRLNLACHPSLIKQALVNLFAKP